MKRTIVITLFVPLLVLIAWLGMVAPNTTASATGADKVVVMACFVDTAATPAAFRTIRVAGASSSAKAPEVPAGERTNCAQALAVLFSTGFELMNVEGNAGGALYTLRQRN